jgi:hypothetical protein
VGETGPNHPLNIQVFSRYKRVVTKDFLVDESRMVSQQRVAIDARVSTVDKGQAPDTQWIALRAYAERRGLPPVGESID